MTNTNDAPRSLAPCPFCGGPASMEWSEYELDSGWHVICHGKKSCPLFCSSPYRVHDTQEEAAEVWNTRAPRSPAPLGWREAAMNEPDYDVRIGLDAIRRQIKRWIDYDARGQEVSPDKHIMSPPTWPSHGQLNAWVTLFEKIDERLSALPVDGGLGQRYDSGGLPLPRRVTITPDRIEVFGSSPPKSDDTQPVADGLSANLRTALIEGLAAWDATPDSEGHGGDAALAAEDDANRALADAILPALREWAFSQQAENCKLGGDAEGVDQGAQPKQESGT
jgi:hypothetical protein